MSILPTVHADESIDAYCYVENNRNVLNLLNELSIDIDKFYFTTYNHLGTPRYTMISVLALSDGTIVEFYAESRNNMHFKRAITIPQDVFEAIKLVPKEAREEYLAAIIKDAYNEGIKELSKPRG
ncbi:HCP-like protein [Acinetobacter phage VB_ApiP_XC38]|uniref:HCP-like protein n=1 Tax=Acinetobacter phage VB_ApiP_XC38 TaxID=2655002 RepID=A0A5P8PR52_9CAUD|nr:HCP-like protein [Acinetobacter phage VB_ApiP_XC38]QFR59753.1 HCP-like protein [Acinetobacter phage VB_ApiP_XC38]